MILHRKLRIGLRNFGFVWFKPYVENNDWGKKKNGLLPCKLISDSKFDYFLSTYEKNMQRYQSFHRFPASSLKIRASSLSPTKCLLPLFPQPFILNQSFHCFPTTSLKILAFSHPHTQSYASSSPTIYTQWIVSPTQPLLCKHTLCYDISYETMPITFFYWN